MSIPTVEFIGGFSGFDNNANYVFSFPREMEYVIIVLFEATSLFRIGGELTSCRVVVVASNELININIDATTEVYHK